MQGESGADAPDPGALATILAFLAELLQQCGGIVATIQTELLQQFQPEKRQVFSLSLCSIMFLTAVRPFPTGKS